MRSESNLINLVERPLSKFHSKYMRVCENMHQASKNRKFPHPPFPIAGTKNTVQRCPRVTAVPQILPKIA